MSGLTERTLKEAGQSANPNLVATQVLRNRLGNMMAGGRRFFAGAVGAVTAHVLTLPADAKALALQGGFAVAGAVTGPITPIGEGVALAASQAQVTPAGDILFLAADAVTLVEVFYVSQEDDLVAVDVIVIPGTGVGALLPYTGYRLISAEALTGTVVGAATVLERGSAPATTQAALSLDGSAVQFLIADAVSSARLVFMAQPGTGPTPETIADQTNDIVNY